MKKGVIVASLLLIVLIFFACEQVSTPKTLLISLENSKNLKNSEAFPRQSIEKALVSGGQIKITIEALRELDPEFDNKYTVVNNEENFMTLGALINFLNDRGWKYQDFNMGLLVMVK